MNDVIALPLFHNSLPVPPSRAYSTDAVPRCPADAEKITPFTIIGVIGEVMSRDFQPCSKVVVSFCSTSFQAPIPLAVQGIPDSC